MAFKDYLLKLMKRNHIGNNKLSIYSGVASSTITYIIHGKRNPKATTLKKLAKGLHVPYIQLLKHTNYAPEIPNDTIKENGPYRRLPVIDQIACGNPIDAIKTTGTYKLTDAIGLPSGINYWLKCEGDSMFPTITNGSHVLIHQQSVVGEGHIAATQIRDKHDDRPDVTLKRVVKQDKHIIVLKPDNSHYDPIIMDKDNPGKIIGRAIKVEHDL